MADDPLGEYEAVSAVDASPDDVFAFVSDVRNLPKYLPTTKDAQSQGTDRVRVQGEAQGHRYDSDGYLRPDAGAKRLEWGADEGYYSGWMQIDGDGDASNVTVHISLRGKPPGAPDDGAPKRSDVQEGLEKGLQSIKNHVEGRGGKEEPAVAT